MKSTLKYFNGSLLFTFFALAAASVIGFYYSQSIDGAIKALFLASVLAILEVSLSFDNAIVNATVLRDMSPLWQKRFLTWGMLIAVFGMRIVFPLVIVSVAGSINPYEALKLAIFSPDSYSQLMLTAHIPVVAFGGSFLFMVGLKYFFDKTKTVHWIQAIEVPLTRLGKMEAIEAAVVLFLIYYFSKNVPPENQIQFVLSGIMGLVTFILVDGIEAFIGHSDENENEAEDQHKITNSQTIKATANTVVKSGLSSFLYLEVLDASFSFDGVVGAFAISNNLFIIAFGLAIGAMFVRSMTIYLVEKNTLSEFKYIEHGAFYAILTLALIMFLESYLHISEWITGLIGATLIIISFASSIKAQKSSL